MAIPPGTRLGPYEVVSAIGAGGMGEVYRARDPRLNRDVALKVLPKALAAEAEPKVGWVGRLRQAAYGFVSRRPAALTPLLGKL